MDFLLREDDLNIHTNMHIHKCTNMYKQIWSIFRVHISEHLLVDPFFLSFILFLHEVSIGEPAQQGADLQEIPELVPSQNS